MVTPARPRVLLAGMHVFDNNFSRQLLKMGCDVIHYDGKKSNAFPRFCDFAVITTAQNSHQAFWDVKDAYRAMNKPIFPVGHSFSPIKERVEQVINKWKAKHQTVMGIALENVMQPKQTMSETSAHTKYVGGAPNTKMRYEPAAKARISQLVSECLDAGMTGRETSELLNAEGLRTTRGTLFNESNGSTLLYQLKVKRAAQKALPTKRPATQVAVPPTSNDDQLMLKILDAGLSPQRTVELIRKSQTGEFAPTTVVWWLDALKESRK